MKTATVTKIGKFFKVITNSGEDISNQIERPMRKLALELGKSLEFNESNSCWIISGHTTNTSNITKVNMLKKSAVEKLENEIIATEPKKRERREYNSAEMPKPTYELDTIVDVIFLSSKRKVKLTDLKRNPQYPNRWIYSGIDMLDGTKMSYIGVNNSEEFSNIV